MKYIWLILSIIILIRSGYYILLDIGSTYYSQSIGWHTGGLLPGLIFIWLTWRAFKK